MNTQQYLDALKQRILSEPRIITFQVLRERSTVLDGYLRGLIHWADDSKLEFTEYVCLQEDGEIQTVTYSYHWSDSENCCIKRWDNTPHHPELPGFPHHVHAGAEEMASSGGPVNLLDVLDEIIQSLSR